MTEKQIADYFGIDESLIIQIVRSGMENGISRDAALLGARLTLSLETGIHG